MTPDDLLRRIEDEGGAPGIEAVAAFEQRIGVTLPDDYRHFLAATGGGQIEHWVDFPMGIDTDHLSRVLGLSAQGVAAIETVLAEDREEGLLPKGLLRIMENGAGDAIAITLRADRLGEIFLIDHEVSDDEQPTPTIEIAESDDWGYALPLAPSFTAFVATLTVRD